MTRAPDLRESWTTFTVGRERLRMFAQALLAHVPERWTVEFSNTGTACCIPSRRRIELNLGQWPHETIENQWLGCLGMLAHEVGHVLYTESWPSEGVLAQLVNMLEDERIERRLRVGYPGVGAALDWLGQRFLRQAQSPGTRTDDQVVALVLIWRWAFRHGSHSAILSGIGATAETRKIWQRVRPLVERAWNAPTCAAVTAIAREILPLIGIKPTSMRQGQIDRLLQRMGIPTNELVGSPIPSRATVGVGAPQVLILDPLPSALAGGGHGLGDLRADRYLAPAPYEALETKVDPLARDLAAALVVQQPDAVPVPDPWRGRYSYRLDVRTDGERPHWLSAEPGPSRSIAAYLLADRSGSMEEIQQQVREAMMTVRLATAWAGVPLGIGLCGDGERSSGDCATIELSPITAELDEAVKANIAGYAGCTGAEWMERGIMMGLRALATRDEHEKVLIVIHDGFPVLPGEFQRLKQLLPEAARAGVQVVGLYLGNNADSRDRMRQLFGPNFIECAPAQLSKRLAYFIEGLARIPAGD